MVADARLEPARFSDLAGWERDDHGAAFATFRRSCGAILAGEPALRPAAVTGDDLRQVCAGRARPRRDRPEEFFERRFQPFWVVPPSGQGFSPAISSPSTTAR
jgi:membrane-bound lytic murein transglycosylase A